MHVRLSDSACDPGAGAVAPGKVTIEVENATSRRVLFGITNLPPDYDLQHPPLDFSSLLSGGRLLTTQTFRDLFRSQVIEAAEGIGVRDVALLFTDLKGSTELYDRIGDLKCLLAGAAAFRMFNGRDDSAQRCSNKDNRRCRYGRIPEVSGCGRGRARDAQGDRTIQRDTRQPRLYSQNRRAPRGVDCGNT